MNDRPYLDPLRALTLWPEWAFAVHHLGKRVENRTWKIPKDEWIMLHAGKYLGGKPGRTALCSATEALDYMSSLAGWTRYGATYQDSEGREVDIRDTPLLSHILGAFRVTHHDMPFKGDLSGWRVPEQVGNVFDYRPLAAPVPCKGAQGLWHVPDDVRAQFAWP